MDDTSGPGINMSEWPGILSRSISRRNRQSPCQRCRQRFNVCVFSTHRDSVNLSSNLSFVFSRSVQLALMLPTRILLPTLSKIGSPKFRRFVVDMVPWKNVRRLRDISDTLHNIAVEIYETKKRAIEEGDEAMARQIGGGKDIMSILSEHDWNFLWDNFINTSRSESQHGGQ
jgi:hypothetical protein